MKRVICIIIAIVTCLAMACPVFAAEGEFVPSIGYKGTPDIVEVKDPDGNDAIGVIRDKDGNYIKENNSRGDKFGHAALGGAGKTVEGWIASELGFKTRSIELSTLQRCFAAGTSLCDVTEAFNAGVKGVEFALAGHTGMMAGFKRTSNSPYNMEVVPMPVCDIANFEKKIPDEMITADGFGLTEKFCEYARPLITGEPDLVYKNGSLQFAPKL